MRRERATKEEVIRDQGLEEKLSRGVLRTDSRWIIFIFIFLEMGIAYDKSGPWYKRKDISVMVVSLLKGCPFHPRITIVFKVLWISVFKEAS